MIFLPSVERAIFKRLNSDSPSIRFAIDKLLYCQDDSDIIKTLCLRTFEVDEIFLVRQDDFKTEDLLDAVHVHNGCVYAWNNKEQFLLEGKPEWGFNDFHWRRIVSVGGMKFNGPSFSYDEGDSYLCALHFTDGDDDGDDDDGDEPDTLALYRINLSEETKEWAVLEANNSFKDHRAFRQSYQLFSMRDGFYEKVIVAGKHAHFFNTFYDDYDEYTASRIHVMLDFTTFEWSTNYSYDALPSLAKIGAVDWSLSRAYKNIKPSARSQIFVYKGELWILSTGKNSRESLLHRCDRASWQWIKMACISDDGSLFRIRDAPFEIGSQVIFTRSATITGLSFKHTDGDNLFELSFEPCLYVLEFEPTLCDRTRAVIARDSRAARLGSTALPIRLRGFLDGKVRSHRKLDAWTIAQGDDDISEHAVEQEGSDSPFQPGSEDDDETYWARVADNAQRFSDDLPGTIEWLIAGAKAAAREELENGSDVVEEPEDGSRAGPPNRPTRRNVYVIRNEPSNRPSVDLSAKEVSSCCCVA